jgi:hypothetical protein
VRDHGTNDLHDALRLLRTRHEVWVAGGAGDPSPLGAALVNRYLAARTLNPPVSASRRSGPATSCRGARS